jgi:hypothetical protein
MTHLVRTRERLLNGFCKFSNMAVPKTIRAMNCSALDVARRSDAPTQFEHS